MLGYALNGGRDGDFYCVSDDGAMMVGWLGVVNKTGHLLVVIWALEKYQLSVSPLFIFLRP